MTNEQQRHVEFMAERFAGRSDDDMRDVMASMVRERHRLGIEIERLRSKLERLEWKIQAMEEEIEKSWDHSQVLEAVLAMRHQEAESVTQ